MSRNWARRSGRLAAVGFALFVVGIWVGEGLQGRLLATGGACMFAALITLAFAE